MKPHLVVFRAGPASQAVLAPQWLASPDFDVALCWDGPLAPAVPGAAFVHAAEGAKWPALARALAAHAARVSQHRYVWLPDAGLDCGPDDVARLFAICEHLGLDLAQPAFTPSSCGAPPVALRHGEFQLRFTNWVDPAAPVFSRALLARAMPALEREAAGAWLGLARPGRVAVVDATPVGRRALPQDSGGGPEALTFNLGGLLESGDAVCLSDRPADVDTLLEAVIRSCTAFTLDASTFARYLAAHLDATPMECTRAALPAVLEHEMSAAEMKFNRVPPPHGDAAASTPSFAAPPAIDAPAAALVEADLRDLRERYATLLAERDRQAALLDELARELALAQRQPRDALPPSTARPAPGEGSFQ